MLIIDNKTVADILTMEATVDALENAYRQHVHGEAVCRPRIDIEIPTTDPQKKYRWGTMEGGSMSGYFAIRMKSDIIYKKEYQGVTTEEKYCVQPGTYCGLVLLTSVNTGEPLAIVNDGIVQQMRVGADGGLGVKYAARMDVETVGILGSGGQARSHMAAYMHVRPGIKRLQVFSPTRENCQRFADEMAEKYNIDVIVCDSPEQIYRNADIVAALTDSTVPILDAERIEAGTHVINIGGGGSPGDSVLERVDLYLRFGDAPAPRGRPEMKLEDEHLTYAAEPLSGSGGKSGKFAKSGHGALLPDRMVTFSDIVNKNLASARINDKQISYSERGNLQGQQFWSVTSIVYEKAKKLGLGRQVPTEWLLQDIRN